MWKYQNTDELYHYGILGMRWGIRRYQNKDGTLTNAGKRRYKSYDYVESRKIKRKRISQMSNNELRKLNERQRLESQYKQQNSRIVKGIAAVTAAAAVVGAMTNIRKNSPALLKSGKKIIGTDRYSKIIKKGKNVVEMARYQKWLFMHR